MKIVSNYLRPQSCVMSSDFVVVNVLNNTYVDIDFSKVKKFYISRSGQTIGINFNGQLMPHHFIWSSSHKDEPIQITDKKGNIWKLFVYRDNVTGERYLVTKSESNIYFINEVGNSIDTIERINLVDRITCLDTYSYLDIVDGNPVIMTLKTNNVKVVKQVITPKLCVNVHHLGNNLVKTRAGYFLLSRDPNFIESFTLVNPYKFMNKSYGEVYLTPQMAEKAQLFDGKFHTIGRNNPDIKIREIIARMYKWSLACDGKETLFIIKERGTMSLRKIMVVCNLVVAKAKDISFGDLSALNLRKENKDLKRRCIQEAMDLLRYEDTVKLKKILRSVDGNFMLTVKDHFGDLCKRGIKEFLELYNLREEITVGELIRHPEFEVMLTHNYFRNRLLSIFNK